MAHRLASRKHLRFRNRSDKYRLNYRLSIYHHCSPIPTSILAEFLKPSDEYVPGVVQPQLPDNFEQLTAAEQKLATSTRDDDIVAKSYELRHFQGNKDIYTSLNLPPISRNLFIRCGEAGEEGTVALRACLAEFYRSWSPLGLSGECPISFTEEGLLRTDRRFQGYRDWHSVGEFAREYLNTDADGWISSEFDAREVRERNKAAFGKYMKEMSKWIPSREARMRWPFLEGC